MECLKLAYYEKNLSQRRPLMKIEESEKTCVSLLYFGARYYNSDISVWLSVDIKSDRYPYISPYLYCLGTPVRFVDPDGKDIYIYGTDGSMYRYMGGALYTYKDNQWELASFVPASFEERMLVALNEINSGCNGEGLISYFEYTDNNVYMHYEEGGYFGQTMPPLSVKPCHFERHCKNIKFI